jgi:2-methylcitrate dehydratase PrpD
MDASFSLAANVVNIRYEDIPGSVVETTKKSILDTLGVILAGSTTDETCKKVVGLVKEGGGKKESTIIAYGGKVPSWMAAFANGSMAHTLDYDDVIDAVAIHPTASTLPAAFAVAERVGGVSGKEFIAAVTLGNDLVSRLKSSLVKPLEFGWAPPPLFGFFSATAAAGKLLGLSKEQMVSAFSIALHQAAGSMQSNLDAGSAIRAIRDAFPAKAGVLSALMAQKGINGGENSLEGKAGFFNLYYRGEYDHSRLTEDLGKRFEGANVSFKPWPCCRLNHPFIDATLSLIQENSIETSDVKSVTAVVSRLTQRICCEPFETMKRPEQSILAKRSLPFAIALAITRGEVLISDFLSENLEDPVVLKVVDKVSVRYDPVLDEPGLMPAIVQIETRDGKVRSKRVDFAYGHPQHPLSLKDLVAKFRDCARYSATALPGATVDRVIEMAMTLEQVDDAGELVRLLG